MMIVTCKAKAKTNARKTLMLFVDIFRSLGFIIYPQKTVLTPKKKIFGILSKLSGPDWFTEKNRGQKRKHSQSLRKQANKTKAKRTIRELAQVLRQLLAAFPAVQWRPLFYRALDKDKTIALKKHKVS